MALLLCILFLLVIRPWWNKRKGGDTTAPRPQSPPTIIPPIPSTAADPHTVYQDEPHPAYQMAMARSCVSHSSNTLLNLDNPYGAAVLQNMATNSSRDLLGPDNNYTQLGRTDLASPLDAESPYSLGTNQDDFSATISGVADTSYAAAARSFSEAPRSTVSPVSLITSLSNPIDSIVLYDSQSPSLSTVNEERSAPPSYTTELRGTATPPMSRRRRTSSTPISDLRESRPMVAGAPQISVTDYGPPPRANRRMASTPGLRSQHPPEGYTVPPPEYANYTSYRGLREYGSPRRGPRGINSYASTPAIRSRPFPDYNPYGHVEENREVRRPPSELG